MRDSIETVKPLEKSKLRAKWRRGLIVFVIICILSYIISIFVINSSWFKDKITAKLEQKFPSNWEVGRITWIPFGDVIVRDVKTSMGEGGIKLNSLTVKPSWGELLSGNIELNELIIQDSHLDVDLEWIKENQSDVVGLNQPIESISDHPVKKIPKLNKDKEPKKAPQASIPKKPIERQDSKTAHKTNKNSGKDVGSRISTPEIFKEPNKWIKAKNLKISFRYGKEIFDEVENVKLKIPVAGKPAIGEILLTVHGREFNQKVNWDGRLLKAEDLKGGLFGVSYQWQTLINISQPSLPFSFEFNAPKQHLDVHIDQPNLHWGLKANDIMASIKLNGGLKSPQTWRGLFLASANEVTISENQKTNKQGNFDQVRFVGNLSRGKLQVPIAEATGYDVSILGNGVIHSNLYSYGVMRIITNNKSNLFFNRVHRATKAINVGPRHMQFFEHLDTPDRSYCDLYFDGKLNDLEMRHNRSAHWQKVKLVMTKLINFKDAELKEDGFLETPEEVQNK